MRMTQPPTRAASAGARRQLLLLIAKAVFVGAVLIGTGFYAWLQLSRTCQEAVLRPPVNISAAWISPSKTRIQWAPSINDKSNSIAYAVSVCEAHGPCVADSRHMRCRHLETSDASLDFRSKVDTSYCGAVKAFSRCESDAVMSDLSVMELRTPSFAPEDFQVTATATSPTTAEIVAFLPQVKNGVLEICYIILYGTEAETTFSCSAEDDMASVTLLTGLKPNTQYNLSVTFANMHDGWEMGTRKTASFMTLYDLTDAENSKEGYKNSKENPDHQRGLCVAVMAAIFLFSFGTEDDQRRWRRRRQRRY